VIDVLIIMLAGCGSAIGAVDFNAEDACEAAAKAIAQADRPMPAPPRSRCGWRRAEPGRVSDAGARLLRMPIP